MVSLGIAKIAFPCCVSLSAEAARYVRRVYRGRQYFSYPVGCCGATLMLHPPTFSAKANTIAAAGVTELYDKSRLVSVLFSMSATASLCRSGKGRAGPQSYL